MLWITLLCVLNLLFQPEITAAQIHEGQSMSQSTRNEDDKTNGPIVRVRKPPKPSKASFKGLVYGLIHLLPIIFAVKRKIKKNTE